MVENNKKLLGFDILTFIVTLLLVCIGISFIYSSGYVNSETKNLSEFIKQILWAVVGFIFIFLLIIYDYNKLKSFNKYLYIMIIILLIAVLLFGKTVNGAKAWLGIGPVRIQPAEFAKLITILTLANFIEEYKKNISELKYFIIASLIVFLPFALILIQPDLGSASVFVPIFLGMMYIGGANVKYLIYIIAFGFLSIIFAILPAWESLIVQYNIPVLDLLTNNFYFYILLSVIFVFGFLGFLGFYIFKKRYYISITILNIIIFLSLCSSKVINVFLKEYQMKRLVVFLNPKIDPLDSGYHILQSLTAVGSGGFFGKGFLNGKLGRYEFLPQRSTDFIFSIIAEELGFFGCTIFLGLYLFLIIRIFILILQSKDLYGKVIITGIGVMFFYHSIVNIGMAIGVMPITGIPLLLISYGGSSLLTSLISIGFVLNINKQRYGY